MINSFFTLSFLLFLMSSQEAKAQDTVQVNCEKLCDQVQMFVDTYLESKVAEDEWLSTHKHRSGDSSFVDIAIGVKTDTIISIQFIVVNERISSLKQRANGKLMGMEISNGKIQNHNPGLHESFYGFDSMISMAEQNLRIMFFDTQYECRTNFCMVDCKFQEELDQIRDDFFQIGHE